MAQRLSVTGRETFDRLTDTWRKFAVPVNNPVAFGSLRAAAALRGGNPATSRLTAMNLHTVNTDCFCHLADFCRKSWGKALVALIKGQIGKICGHLTAQGQQLIKSFDTEHRALKIEQNTRVRLVKKFCHHKR